MSKSAFVFTLTLIAALTPLHWSEGAVVYHSNGDYARASELYRASIKTWEEATEKPPEDYEIVASNYADLLRSLGKARQANQLEERARKKRRT